MKFDVEGKQRELDLICSRHNVLRLSLFGSATTGEFDADRRSDLDFAVEFAAMKPLEHKRAYFGLLRDLEYLFERSVDLIETKAVTNPYIRRSIETQQRVVYGAA